jgi:hypothetical protein
VGYGSAVRGRRVQGGAVVALLFVCTSAKASTIRVDPVPAAFAAKAGRVCVELKHSLDSHKLPLAVARAVKLIPGHATRAQYELFGNYLAKTQGPAYRQAVARFRALGQPPTGAAAWKRFLGGFSAWVTANEGFVQELQSGVSPGFGSGSFGSQREAAFRRLRSVTAATGTHACLAAVG